jgi:hypothetical protein
MLSPWGATFQINDGRNHSAEGGQPMILERKDSCSHEVLQGNRVDGFLGSHGQTGVGIMDSQCLGSGRKVKLMGTN